jgi:transcriptional regulator with XRE-family HTH domain
VTKFSIPLTQENEPPSFGERLTFAIWLAGKVLGVENSEQFARAAKKGPSQLSKWAREDPRPNWDSIKALAEAVQIDPVWLDDSTRPNAIEPPDFPQWIAARRQRAQQTRPKRRARG